MKSLSALAMPGMVPRTSSTGITWELFGNADFQALPPDRLIQNLCFDKNPRAFSVEPEKHF